MDIDELDRNDVAGSLAYYEANRERFLKMAPHQRSAFLQPLLQLHDDPRGFSRRLKSAYPND